MSSDVRPFEAIGGASVRVTNAVASAAATLLPKNSTAVLLTNNSLTAIAYYRVTTYLDEGSPPDGDAPTTTTDTPIQPSGQIRVYTGQVGMPKLIRLIASAADSYTTVTPGDGI